ncbi:MAG: hypothetical protein ACD_30C00056G0013 [uncultured bacterium]|uniref:C-methyltransferase n=4 Tax=Candidatus Daviesiibacteriota TaxID=1752718 RepID=A0A0G0F6T1_9BACT|nr:MAG: hypothetical protein ACD_30C00056G0013 [uncultured bacterium]KKQ09210.1 MAG: C-methyltransferase [Candidatus Daviesbacteria bacterium GW2011_GWB1_36_5]KKQ14721.1 MAG: C-methyltransferase [Candidatus Daviesbacteria bacterium GW2011_GWA1_36_8]OGE17052.1 MAG: SAM-dependent methyltransferase [Candidatus Daviesbacteria bacterium RIFCSPHIGHO2_01_FULL_36_37]OGE32685.1 MAG: SAM-dependent methyltransferase [Candidatus Daviesbacteria bacterium RIFCSPHIGHO2_02_FULL_37_9]OGE36096.1 MAG: SAM-depend
MKNKITCRFCKTPLKHTFVDLGMSPIANNYVKNEDTDKMEPFYSLHVYVCSKCFLVQIPSTISRDIIFNDQYAYYSSYSTSWLEHAKNYVEKMTNKFSFTKNSLVVELASNDGYLLQYFKEKQIPVLGIEPCANVAKVAQKKGIPSLIKFFGVNTAKELVKKGKKADLILGNNVLAHVPDVNDFVGGMKILLNPKGIITIEFPHLEKLVEHKQFDTIYHEHYSYFSFLAVEKIFAFHGITLFDVEEIKTHGGSLRIYGRHTENKKLKVTKNVTSLRDREIKKGYKSIKFYQQFDKEVKKSKRNFLKFLIQTKKEGKTIVGYGAPAKGNTFLNYCGVRTDFIDYTVDKNPHKQGHVLPGVHIPIHDPKMISKTKPDYILILPWNLKEEIMEQMHHIRQRNGKFIIAIPKVKVL